MQENSDQIQENQVYPTQETVDKLQRDLRILYEVSNAMRTTLELDNILHIILTGVTAHTGLGFNRAVLFLINTKHRCLEPAIAIGPESGEDAERIWNYISNSNKHMDDLIEAKNSSDTKESAFFDSIKSLKIPLVKSNQSLLAKAFNDGVPVHIPPDKIGNYSDDILLEKFKTNELIIMPLKAKDKVNGIIIADNLFTQKAITEDDLKIFMMLANQAGLAIENSRLYEMVMHKSHTDAITGLWNHGFFQEQLSKDISAAKESKQPLSLLIMDIDDFKKLNDTYGHQNGDIILKKIAQILKSSSRDHDHACRYGGEEFAVILNETDKETGKNIAERIRENVEKYVFPKFSSEHHVKVTMSIGIATFPEDAPTKEELILRADQSMYVAKFSGKNIVCEA